MDFGGLRHFEATAVHSASQDLAVPATTTVIGHRNLRHFELREAEIQLPNHGLGINGD